MPPLGEGRPSPADMGIDVSATSEIKAPETAEKKVVSAEAVDDRWYDRFLADGSIQAYEYFEDEGGTRGEEKKKFEAGEVENPTFQYPKLDKEDLLQRDHHLRELKKDVLEQEQNVAVREAYRWRINEKLAEIGLMKAAAEGKMRKFDRYTKFVYGEPSKEIFAYTVDQLRAYAEKHTASANTDIAEYAKIFLEMLPKDLPRAAVSPIPTESEVGVAKAHVMEEFSDLMELEGEGESFSGDALKREFELALQKVQAEGWKVEMVNRGTVSVDQEARAVKVSTGAKTRAKIERLLVHEIGTHVKRRINGERSKLRLLGLGLDRYESAEEGMATMREQALDVKVSDFAGLLGHLSISLAQGLDGHPRTFKEVYEWMQHYFTLNAMVLGRTKEAAIPEGQNFAWGNAVRTFRGTDCKTPGVAFTKDLAYREGNIAAWDLVRNKPEELVHLSLGKFDPNNTRHLWILTELGIRDEDLETLEDSEGEEK